jgi:hypothetical protein
MGPWESRAVGGVQSVPDSTPTPTAGAAGARADDRSTARRAGDCGAIGRDDQTGQPVLHVLAERRMDRQSGRLRTTSGSVGVPLRSRGPIVERTAARRRVPSQLSRDRRRGARQATGDLTYAVPVRAQDRQFLAFGDRKVPP